MERFRGIGNRWGDLYTRKSCWQQDISKKEYIAAICRGTLTVTAAAYLFYESAAACLLFLPAVLFYIRSWEVQCRKKKEEIFKQQFQDALQSLTTALSAGYAMENAIRECLKDLKRMYPDNAAIIREFTYMVRQLEMNISIEQILQEFADRIPQEDVQNFAVVFQTAKKSGGDIMAVLRSTAAQICDKIEVKKEIQTSLSAKRLEFKVMTAIPFGIIVYMKLSFPEFMKVLYGNILGISVMTVCLVIYIAAYMMGKQIVEIEV